MGLGESFKEFLGIGKKAASTQTPPPVITPLNPTDVTQRPIDVANQNQGESTPITPSPDPKPAA